MRSDTLYVGVDPGKSGAIAFTTDGKFMPCVRMPLTEKGKAGRVDCRAIARLLAERSVGIERIVVCVERVHSMPKQGLASTFAFGASWGMVIGLVQGLGHVLVEARPQDWQREMLRGYPTAKGPALKRQAVAAASDLWPHMAEALVVKANQGLADAALICEYGRRRLDGKAP